MKKGFIFDMDGVIIDSEPLHLKAVEMVLKEHSLDITDDELYTYIGISNIKMWTDFKKKYIIESEIEELLKKQVGYSSQIYETAELVAINGISELISDLKSKGITIGLASSSSRRFIEFVLKGLKIYEYFDVIVSGDEVKKGKPEPDIFLLAAELMGVEPCRCLVLEDSANGVRGAKSAGMKCIGYKNPNSGLQDLTIADMIISSLEKLEYDSLYNL